MSEWDKLWKEKPMMELLHEDKSLWNPALFVLLDKIKAEGDKMGEKTEKWDAIMIQYGITGDHLVDADEIIHEIEGTKLLKEEWIAMKKLEAIKTYTEREFKAGYLIKPIDILKILGVDILDKKVNGG